MAWHVGQKIICVNDKGQFIPNLLVKDQCYTIEEFELNSTDGNLCFYLCGVTRLFGNNIVCHKSRRFVPLDILNTELNIEELLSNKV